MKKDIIEHLSAEVMVAWRMFNEEISTDENKDYRRGFRAGILCALLQTKVDAMERTKNVD